MEPKAQIMDGVEPLYTVLTVPSIDIDQCMVGKDLILLRKTKPSKGLLI